MDNLVVLPLSFEKKYQAFPSSSTALAAVSYNDLMTSISRFDIALGLMLTTPPDAAFSAVFRTSINAERKQLEISRPTTFEAGCPR